MYTLKDFKTQKCKLLLFALRTFLALATTSYELVVYYVLHMASPRIIEAKQFII